MKYIVRTVSWVDERLRNVEVIKSVIPDIVVLTDTKRDGWNTYFEAMRMLNETGGVLLEDDVILCKGFKERIEGVISQKPDDLINFFERPKVSWCTTKYVGGSQYSSNLCTYYPPNLPIEFLKEYKNFRESKPDKHMGLGYDCLMAHTLVKLKRKYWRIRPCLVQHSMFKSTINNRALDRQTDYFIDDLIKNGTISEDYKWEL